MNIKIMRTTRHLRLLILFVLFMFCFLAMSAQKNTLYISVNPNRYIFDSGLGLTYERKISTFNVYAGFTKGKYSIMNEESAKYIRFACGATKVMSDNPDYKPVVGFGLNWDHVRGNQDLPQRVYRPFSFDIGFGAKVNRVAVLVLYDPLKKVSQINVGYNF